MAAAMGVGFLAVWILSPREGLVGGLLRRRTNRRRFAQALVLTRLVREPATPETIGRDLAWPATRTAAVCRAMVEEGLVDGAGALQPTADGRTFLASVLG
jgi:hypothetical protein